MVEGGCVIQILYTRVEALRILRAMPWQQRKEIKKLAQVFLDALFTKKGPST